MTIQTSKQFSIDLRDLAKGLLVAGLSGVAPIINDTVTQWINGGFGPIVFNFANIWHAAAVGAWGYISLKYFSKAKTVTPVE